MRRRTLPMLPFSFLALFLHLLSLPTLYAQGNAIFQVAAPDQASPTKAKQTVFHVTSGANENYFYRDNITTAQLLLTSASSATVNTTRRLVAALPAGNNGALVYFIPIPPNNTQIPQPPSGDKSHSPAVLPFNINLVNGTLHSTISPDGSSGIQADVSFSTSATLGVTIVGAVRALRDYVEGSGTMHEIFNYTLLEYSRTAVRLHRQYINTTDTPTQKQSASNSKSRHFKSVDLYLSIPAGSGVKFSVTPSTNGTSTPPRIDIVVPPKPAAAIDINDPATRNAVRFQVVTNEDSLVGFNVNNLFMTPDQNSTAALQGVLQGLSGMEDVVDQVSFLTFEDKFVAGGWRFLTYFGRDSLIALRMLMPILTSDAIEAALGAVVERANSTGALCHEETIGDYASFINIGNGRPDLGNTPFYDYKMIDTDLLLLPAMAHFFVDLPQGQNRSTQFMNRQAVLQQGSYLDIVNRIASYNINRALPFYLASTPSASNMLAFRPGQPVGNWRDSNQGTGYGTIPFDVNVALVPANLRAINSLINAGILNAQDLDLSSSAVDLISVASKWEQDVPALFEVTVTGQDAEARLADFVQEVGLDQSLLGTNNTSSPQDVSFYALSLMPDGTPVEVLNSDLGFNLVYGTNLSVAFMERVADALTAYPRGLLTNVGMVVANPAYDSNRTNVHVLDRTAYHGTVVWSFQQALMAGGLARQLAFCENSKVTTVDMTPPLAQKPLWCDNANLLARLQDGQKQLWTSIDGAAANIYSEVWSYSFDDSTKTFQVADIATLSPEGTESDAIQLWSYGFLGLIAPR